MNKHICLLALLGCFLGLHSGQLALYSRPDAAPYLVLPYRVGLYPKADQQALRGGICVENQQDLEQLLEDYLS